MKNLILLLLVCFLVFTTRAQIVVGPNLHNTLSRPGQHDKETIDEFKSSTTIFVIESSYDKASYQKILDEVWTVTAFKIVDLDSFNLFDYQGNYSFAKPGGTKLTSQRRDKNGLSTGPDNVHLTAYFDISMYDIPSISKKIDNAAFEMQKKKTIKFIETHTTHIARIYLYSKYTYINSCNKLSSDELIKSYYNLNNFYAFEAGFFKNYIQKVNSLLIANESYSAYKGAGAKNKELSKLKGETLRIPKYITANWQRSTIKELFKDYPYKYSIVSDKILNSLILNEYPIFYLRYVCVGNSNFISIVNSVTGEVIYSQYNTVMLPRIKAKHIEELNKAISN